MEHDLVGAESLALGCHNVGNGGRKLQLVVCGVLEDADLVASNNEGTVVLVAHSQLRVFVAVLGRGFCVVFGFIRIIVLAALVIGIFELLLVLFFLLFLRGILHGHVLESLEHVLSICVLGLLPFDLVQMLPQRLHDTILDALQLLLVLEPQQPGVSRSILQVMVEDERLELVVEHRVDVIDDGLAEPLALVAYNV